MYTALGCRPNTYNGVHYQHLGLRSCTEVELHVYWQPTLAQPAEQHLPTSFLASHSQLISFPLSLLHNPLFFSPKKRDDEGSPLLVLSGQTDALDGLPAPSLTPLPHSPYTLFSTVSPGIMRRPFSYILYSTPSAVKMHFIAPSTQTNVSANRGTQ